MTNVVCIVNITLYKDLKFPVRSHLEGQIPLKVKVIILFYRALFLVQLLNIEYL